MDSKFYFDTRAERSEVKRGKENEVLFDLKKTTIYQAILLANFFKIVEFFKKIFFVLFIIASLLFLYGFILEAFPIKTNQILLGTSFLFLSFLISCWLKLLFFNLKLKKPKTKTTIGKVLIEPEKYNLAEFLSFEIIRAIHKSIEFAGAKKLFEINSTSLFYFLLQDNQKLNFIFSRALLSIKNIKDILKEHLKIYQSSSKKRKKVNFESGFSEDFQNTIFESLKIAEKKKHQKVEIEDLFIALAKHNLIFQEIINNSEIKIDDIEHITDWLEFLERKIERRKKFWLWENLIKKGTLAKEWASGFTITLDRFSIDLSKVAKKRAIPETIGHKKTIEAIERILLRQESNNDVLLVGEPGIGKKSIIQGLALKSVLGQSFPGLNYKRIVALDIPTILTQTNNQKEIEMILDKIFREVLVAGNVILVINDFHNFIRTEMQPGIIDISGVLAPYLPSPQFQIIAMTTYGGLHKYIERKSGILEFFEKVEVPEISEKETLMLLERLALAYEQKHKKFISYLSLKKIISLADRYIPIEPYPKKAINLLDEVMIYADSIKDKVIFPEHIAKVVSEKTEIPVGEIEIKEREILLNLEKLIHQRIINQEEAVKEVSTALRRARLDITTRKRPMGTFLFLGPSGVGKTETAKALAEIYFGSEKKMIRIDMSEFQNLTDIPHLIGSIEEDGLLTTQVRENPFSIILLDEIEKAHKNILHLFLQVLDEGHLTDGLSRKINFENTMIIATSNAGSQIILEALKQKSEWSQLKEKILDYVFEKTIFRPEFINRFDAVVVFQHLTKKNLLDIVELMFQKIKKNLKDKNINFIINELLKRKIVELGYNPVFGARELKRVVQDKIENLLAPALLSGELKRGDTVEIVIEQNEFKMKIE
jgi:ATP-dependent Clp protease ATP-binding subunit ClpC